MQKALGLRSVSLFASASFRNMLSLFLINRRAYLNLDLHFPLWYTSCQDCFLVWWVMVMSEDFERC